MRYVAIRSEGGLIPYDLLDKIATEDVSGQKPSDFGLPKGRRLTDEISRVWSDAQSLWDIIRRRRESLSEKDPYGTTLTRDRWIVPLLSDAEMLGFDLRLQPSGVVVDNLTFNLSHRSGEGEDAIPVHIEGLKIDLDKRLHTKLRTSPQAMVQEFLNHSESVLWGIVTNGLTLRLLRDSSRTSRPTYVEFDLENILEGNRFAEFALFYRLCHRSRFPRPGQNPSECILEKYYLQSIDEGSRVREGLRAGVEETLKIFGNAFLQHPANRTLREKLTSGRLNPVQYHRQLLLLVYRLLFLMVAEERRLIVSQGEGSERNQKIYDQWYSVSALRDRASRIIEESPFGDVWLGVLQTFSLFEYGVDSNPLGIPPLNGDLFNQDRAVPDLVQTQLYNHDLLRAVRHLSVFKADGLQQRVNYAALDVEELGSVYESLLAYQPVVEPGDTGLEFDLRTGSERKSTGSYYTRPELVHELIESALVPVMEDRIAQAEKTTEGKDLRVERDAKVKAILAMTVCDPACGSGHFLLAAARRLGKEVARIKTGEDEPTPEEFHLAVREVIQHCIYGVDLNPLAVDLCKLAMWLEGHWAGKPLSFLDHRIRCGNSLIGVLDPAVLEDGIPDDAFTAVTGDDKKVASHFKKRNKQDRTSRGFSFGSEALLNEYAEANRELSEMTEDTAAAVRRKAELYSSWRTGMKRYHEEAVADLWAAQFFVPLKRTDDPAVCTTKDFLEFNLDKQKKPQQVAAAQELAAQIRFFHWHLEYPTVFENGGFDVVLGNPPWDMVQPEEIAFFYSIGESEISRMNGHERKVAISNLCVEKPQVASLWNSYQRDMEAVAKFIRRSPRFPLTAIGKLDTSSLFAELVYKVVRNSGRLGLVLPSGIATDDNCQTFFSEIATNASVVSLFDFENKERLFSDVAPVQKFCLLTVAKRVGLGSRFAWYLTLPEQINNPIRVIKLEPTDLALLNPNTGTAPLFRTNADALLTRGIYKRVPILKASASSSRAWDINLKQGLFNMTSASELFSKKRRAGYLALYEAKFIHQYDHRHSTYEGVSETSRYGMKAGTNYPSERQKQDVNYCIEPRYWVSSDEVMQRLPQDNRRSWLIAVRGIAQPMSNERVAMCTVLPLVGIGHSCLVLFPSGKCSAAECGCLVANINSIVFDYVLRQKMGGANIIASVLEQMPVLPPGAYSHDDINFIIDRVVKLIITSAELQCFGADLGYTGSLFIWKEEERHKLRCELDAYFAHLYRLSRDELRYLLEPHDIFGVDYPSETFRILKSKELEEFGEYRTQRLVLTAFDELAASPRFRDEMSKRVSAFEVPKHTN
jgi:hypothetical protein